MVRRIHDFLTDRPNGFHLQPLDRAGHQRQRPRGLPAVAKRLPRAVRRDDGGHGPGGRVPARVALGYTPGSRSSDGTRLITSDDAHAWVEVYFENLGWVPFDPTPIAAGRAVALALGTAGGPTRTRQDSAGAPAPAERRRPPRRRGGTAPTRPSRPRRGIRAVPDVPWPLAGAGLVLAGSRCWAPGWIRALQRRRRVAEGPRAPCGTNSRRRARDGVRLHPARTPRRTAASWRRCRRSGLGRGAAADAVQQLARAEEASYGRDSGGRRTSTTGRPCGRSGGHAARRPGGAGCSPGGGRRSSCWRRRLAEQPGAGLAAARSGGRAAPAPRDPPSDPPPGAPEPPSGTDGGCRKRVRATGRSGGGTAPRAGSSAAGGRSGLRARRVPDRWGRTPPAVPPASTAPVAAL